MADQRSFAHATPVTRQALATRRFQHVVPNLSAPRADWEYVPLPEIDAAGLRIEVAPFKSVALLRSGAP